MIDLIKAKELLKNDNYTCVLIKGNEIFTSNERGVKPLLAFLKRGIGENFSACDKVVGNGAAYLYVLLRIKALHALILSKPAKETLEKNKITVSYEKLVDNIRNRTDTDICPMEKAVIGAKNPEDAYNRIIEKLKELS